MQSETAQKTDRSAKAPRRFIFVLLENFTLLCFSAAVESLRIANRMADERIYEWVLTGEGGKTIKCSAGAEFKLDIDLEELRRDDVVMVCGGINVQAATTKKVLNWLRREARRGLKVGGLCTAAYTVAKAGLLDGKRATIHWENQDSFLEEFEDVELTKSVFVVDGNRMTTAGGTSSIDLMLKIIADDHGEKLANAVADQLIYSSIRTDQGHAAAQRAHTHRRTPPQAQPGHPDDGGQYRRTYQSLCSSTGCWHVDPAVGTAVSALPEPQSQALLHGIAPAKGAKPVDADRHDGDQRGAGLWLCLALAFLEMLPRALQHHPLPRAWRAFGPAFRLIFRAVRGPGGTGRPARRSETICFHPALRGCRAPAGFRGISAVPLQPEVRRQAARYS